MDEGRLEDAVNRIEIRHHMECYADIVSRRAWPELAELFRDDTVVELDLRDRTLSLTGPGEVGDFIGGAIERFAFFQFNVLNLRVHLRSGGDPDRAASRMLMTELRQTHDGHWSTIYGVYHDRLVREDGQWWFAARTYHSLMRKDVPGTLFPFPEHIELSAL